MEWPERLAESLPAPHNDEPHDLRRDIADELGDHLQCALRRQLLITADADRARAEVLARFGDPHQIARQLWFDALKEKLMSQRILVALTVVMSIICLGAVATAWQVVRTNRAAIEANRLAADEMRITNEALRAQLDQLASRVAAGPAKPSDWKPPLKVELVLHNEDGPPAEGFRVHLRQPGPRNTRGLPTNELLAEHKTGADGIADFGRLMPGSYTLYVYTPEEEYLYQAIEHPPGEELVVKIVCPAALPPEAEIKISLQWPEELRDKGLWLLCNFDPGTRSFAGRDWKSFEPIESLPHWLAIPPDGGHIEIRFPPGYGSSRGHERVPRPFKLNLTGSGGQYGFRVDMRTSPPRYFFAFDDAAAAPEVHWRAISYRLNSIGVARDSGVSASGAVRQLDVLGGLLTDHPLVNETSHDTQQFDPPKFIMVPMKDQPEFAAVAGESNSWKISLPDELLTILREQEEAKRKQD